MQAAPAPSNGTQVFVVPSQVVPETHWTEAEQLPPCAATKAVQTLLALQSIPEKGGRPHGPWLEPPQLAPSFEKGWQVPSAAQPRPTAHTWEVAQLAPWAGSVAHAPEAQ